MPVSQSVTVSQAGGDFVASNNPAGAYVVTEGGISWPDFDVRMKDIPDADDVAGTEPNAATLGRGTCALVITVQGSSTADLQAKRRALEAAFSQFSYTLTLEVDGEVEAYPAFMAWPKWGVLDSGMAAAYRARATLSVPVNPMGA